MVPRRHHLALVALLISLPATAEEVPAIRAEREWGLTAPPGASAHERILAGVESPARRSLLVEILERNPGVAAAEARARAARQRLPQVRTLPDPQASLTAYLASPETRTGPQRFSLGISQTLPWPGKLALAEETVLYSALALEAEADEKRLAVLTEARRLVEEIGFLDRYREITEEFRTHLLQHEGISRARYSTGVGLGSGVIKLQAAITRVETDLLELDTRRVEMVARLNLLRDRTAAAALTGLELAVAEEKELELDALRAAAVFFRPELAAADARIAAADARVRLAEKGYRPDFRVGLQYTVVEARDDAAARLQPPAGNGDDIVGLQGGITLPLRRKRLAAAVAEAVELRRAASEGRRQAVASVEAAVGDLALRVPLGWRQLRLVEDLLIVQAQEALESAQAAYVAGTLNALDLLDAEHVLFEARTLLARTLADYLTDLAALEGVLGAPLQSITTTERNDS